MKSSALSNSGLALLAAVVVTTFATPIASAQSMPSRADSTASSVPSASSVGALAPEAAAARNGTFKGDNGKHVAGRVTVSDGKVVLSGFSSDAGPDLHIYLANGATEGSVSAGRQLGTISATQASQTFALGGVDPSKYTTVVIHCDKAKAVFGDAPLA